MKSELVGQNLKIIANQYNPSLFNSYWLVSQEIFTEKEIQPNSIFTPQFVQINSEGLNIIILPEQLQINLTNADYSEKFKKIISDIVTKLPHIPYKAVGINFDFFINNFEQDLTKDLFYNNNFKLSKFFDDSPRFGLYLSKIYKSTRLKLDIKPILARKQGEDTEKEFIHFSFNYHYDINKNNTDSDIKNQIVQWDDYKNYSIFLMDSL
jgi:hypothetical protein